MTVLELLQNARQLLSDPARWTKGCFARNAEGQAVHPVLGKAACWCSVGAIRKEFSREHGYTDRSATVSSFLDAHLLLHQLLSSGKHSAGIPSFNDHPDTTHADVLALFDRAIEHCSSLPTQPDDPDRFAINTAPGQ